MQGDEEDPTYGVDALFVVPDRSEYVFYFSDVLVTAQGPNTEVVFQYSYNRGKPMRSHMTVVGALDDSHRPYLISIGMCVLSWFWMGFGTKYIVVEVEGVTDRIIEFFTAMYSNILLEFCERNNASLPQITASPAALSTAQQPLRASWTQPSGSKKSALIPLGGGKDSLVSLDMALDDGYGVQLLYVTDDISNFESDWRLQGIVDTMKDSAPFHLVRHKFTDPVFMQTSRSSLTPTGHPWAALVIFDALLIAKLHGTENVFFGFEKSADFGNMSFWNGREINHQYDKSSAFLSLVRDYVASEIHCSVLITSPLSEMWDIEVAKRFCEKEEIKKFHKYFLSCNESDGTHSWCRKCEKCAFVFLVLSAFLNPAEVKKIFEDCNLLEESEMTPVFLSLVGGAQDGKKPYECVGTFAESAAAAELTFWKYLEKFPDAPCPTNSPPLPVALKALTDYLDIAEACEDSNDGPTIAPSNTGRRQVDANAIIRKWIDGKHDSFRNKN